MEMPLMPKATAAWLIENTTLTFEQIANFCGMHVLEVKAMADDEIDRNIVPINPIIAGQLSEKEIQRCQKDPETHLKLSDEAVKLMKAQKSVKKTGKYVPIARRGDKPGAISWLLKNCPEFSDIQIVKLIGTTKSTIESVRSKTHWKQDIKPSDPVLLGLCSQSEFDRAYEIAKKRAVAANVDNNELVTAQLDDKMN